MAIVNKFCCDCSPRVGALIISNFFLAINTVILLFAMSGMEKSKISEFDSGSSNFPPEFALLASVVGCFVSFLAVYGVRQKIRACLIPFLFYQLLLLLISIALLIVYIFSVPYFVVGVFLGGIIFQGLIVYVILVFCSHYQELKNESCQVPFERLEC